MSIFNKNNAEFEMRFRENSFLKSGIVDVSTATYYYCSVIINTLKDLFASGIKTGNIRSRRSSEFGIIMGGHLYRLLNRREILKYML